MRWSNEFYFSKNCDQITPREKKNLLKFAKRVVHNSISRSVQLVSERHGLDSY